MNKNCTIIEKKYCITDSSEVETPLSSFRCSDTVRFAVRSHNSSKPDTVVLRIHRDFDNDMKLYKMTSDTNGCAFSVTVPMHELCQDENGGLFYYCYDVYYPDGCVTYGGESPEILQADAEKNKRQLLVYRDDFHTPDWLKGGIIYHIFVDRYRSGRKISPKPGTILHTDWEHEITQFAPYPGAEVANNEFFGGDLYGAAEKIDEIAALGVSCIYLSPVFDAASNHKYDTGDYEHVDEMFGGDDALAYLINAAAEKNIRIILDGVFNHTGADSRYFNQMGHYPTTGAAQSQTSPYYPWYNFSEYPDEYDCWWGVKILPKVRCDAPSYRKYILGDQGIIAKWMQLGVAGWRLDVADELSDGFLDGLRERVHAENPEAVIYGEVWENASNKIAYGKRRRYLCGKQLDAVMNYPLRSAVISYIRDGQADTLRVCVETIYRQYPKEVSDVLMNFLGTHDTARILTELGGKPAEGYSNAQLAVMKMSDEERKTAVDRLKIAYQLISVMPGLPCIFYGDEAGVEGYGDPFCRSTFPWGREDLSLQHFYRETGMFHRNTSVFRDGYVRFLYLNEKAAAVMRFNGKDTPVIFLLNRSDKPVVFTLSKPVCPPGQKMGVITAEVSPVSGKYYFAPSEDVTAELILDNH